MGGSFEATPCDESRAIVAGWFAAAGWDTVSSFRGAMGVFLAACVFGYGWFMWPKDNESQ